MNDIENLMVRHPFLKGMKAEHQKILAESARLNEFEMGQVIFHEGEVANRFYLLLEGRVELETARRGQAPITIQTLGEGDVLGWSWLFPPYFWHFTARTVFPTRAIFFYGTRLREECEQNDELGHDLFKRVASVLMQRLQATRMQLLEHYAASPT